MILYGIPNCDSCRNARKWLERNEIAYRFHDVREDGINRKLLSDWLAQVQWKSLLNTRSTTWRGLPDAHKSNLDQAKVSELLLANPTLIKRPVLDSGSQLLVGFSESTYEEVCN